MTSGKKQILWVDDEIEFLRAHIMFLEEHDYEVAKANNGDDGVALVKREHFDLVFLDEQMPGKDGLTTLEEIKAFKPSLPVVMVTKSEEEKLMEAAFGRNISSYLIKPVNPSQILSVCKQLLHSQSIKKTHITSTYVKKYAQYKADFSRHQSVEGWEHLYQSLSQWDDNLQTLKDQGLEEVHNKHKEEVYKKFIQFVETNYMSWYGGREQNPSLSTQTLVKHVIPKIKADQKVCTLVMAGFRQDQWLVIKKFLEPHFNMQEDIAWSMLPTDRMYSRTALLSGDTPGNLAQQHPDIWTGLAQKEYRAQETKLLQLNLKKHDLSSSVDSNIHYIRSMEESKGFLNEIEKYNSAPLVTLVVEFGELLLTLRQKSPLLMELAPDENGMKELTRIWFQSSNLLKILAHFSKTNRSVVLTSDHGSILVEKPVEVFCQEERTPHPRVKVGKDISCDERYVYFIESHQAYGLPKPHDDGSYAIAKGNTYFTYPNKYNYTGSQFKGQMTNGGLSMEEILVPLINLSPK
jgi:CheY-like chemotaxis protein